MDILFESISDRLKTNIPELNWIDWEWGQLETPEEEYPIQFPCAFIDIQNIDWSNAMNNLLTGNVAITIRVAFDVYEDTHVAGGITTPDRSYALLRLKLINKIHSWLQGFGGFILPDGNGSFRDNHFNRLNAVRYGSEKRDDGLKVFTLQFACNMRNNYAMPVTTPITATPNITAVT
jgi:hypothetical protein